MGSRSFYEGWDSNRPNIVLFIDIGKGSDAKKFVLQSIGRGVRIEPLPNKRRRAVFLYNNREIDEDVFGLIKENIEPLETLFVFGTKADNLKEVIETLKQEKPETLLGDLFEINPTVKDKLLLIPNYRISDKIIVEEKDMVKFPIHPDGYQMVRSYFNYIGDKVAVCKYGYDLDKKGFNEEEDLFVKVLSEVKKGFNEEKNLFIIREDQYKINNPEFLLENIFKHFGNKSEEFETFKKLEEEIIHFKRISTTAEKLNSLREKIEKVKKTKDKDIIKKELKEKLDKKEIDIDEYTLQIEDISTNIVKEAETTCNANEKLKITDIAITCTITTIFIKESERQILIYSIIIKYKSEVDFINELESINLI